MNRRYKSFMHGGTCRIERPFVFTLLLGALALTLAVPVPVLAGGILPPLGTAGSFGVLAGSAVTNTGPTIVRGNVGVSPGTAVSGFPPGNVIGMIHAGDSVAAQAQNDSTIAYNNAAAQACDVNLTGQDLGGMTLIPGVYCFNSSAQLTGQLTLDGQGNPDSVFIFQVGSTLITASNAQVLVINGTQPCRIFWQVGSSATLGTNTRFQGNILALTSITLNTGATTNTGLYALNGAVTLDNNDIQACGFTGGATATNTPAPVGTNTPVNTPAPPRPTNTAIASATGTPAPLPSNTAIAATNTAIAAATNTAIVGATNTAIAVATRTPAPLPSDTAIAATNTAIAAATNTAIVGATNTAIAVATGTPAPPLPSNTAITAATGTPASLPSGTAIAATNTAIVGATNTAIAAATRTPSRPGQPVGMPSTGGEFPWLAPFSLLPGALLLAVGLGMRRLLRIPGES